MANLSADSDSPEGGSTDAATATRGGLAALSEEDRLLTQVERILKINGLDTVTPEVVNAACESLVVGQQ